MKYDSNLVMAVLEEEHSAEELRPYSEAIVAFLKDADKTTMREERKVALSQLAAVNEIVKSNNVSFFMIFQPESRGIRLPVGDRTEKTWSLRQKYLVDTVSRWSCFVLGIGMISLVLLLIINFLFGQHLDVSLQPKSVFWFIPLISMLIGVVVDGLDRRELIILAWSMIPHVLLVVWLFIRAL